MSVESKIKASGKLGRHQATGSVSDGSGVSRERSAMILREEAGIIIAAFTSRRILDRIKLLSIKLSIRLSISTSSSWEKLPALKVTKSRPLKTSVAQNSFV